MAEQISNERRRIHARPHSRQLRCPAGLRDDLPEPWSATRAAVRVHVHPSTVDVYIAAGVGGQARIPSARPDSPESSNRLGRAPLAIGSVTRSSASCSTRTDDPRRELGRADRGPGRQHCGEAAQRGLRGRRGRAACGDHRDRRLRRGARRGDCARRRARRRRSSSSSPPRRRECDRPRSPRTTATCTDWASASSDRNADLAAAVRGPHPDGVDAILDVVSQTPDTSILKEGGRLASPLGAAGDGPLTLC